MNMELKKGRKESKKELIMIFSHLDVCLKATHWKCERIKDE